MKNRGSEGKKSSSGLDGSLTLLFSTGSPVPRGAAGPVHRRPPASALLRRAVPEPLLSSAGCCGRSHVQYPGQPASVPLRAPWQASGGGCSPPGVCRGHPRPTGSLCTSPSTGWGCWYNARPDSAGYCACCQRGCLGLPVWHRSPRDGTVCSRACRAGLALYHLARWPAPLRACSCSLSFPCLPEPCSKRVARGLCRGKEGILPLFISFGPLSHSPRHLFPLTYCFLYEPFCINYLYLIFLALSRQASGPLGREGTGFSSSDWGGGRCTAFCLGGLEHGESGG